MKYDGAELYLRADRLSDKSNSFMIGGIRAEGKYQKSRHRVQTIYPSGIFFDYAVFYQLEKNTIIGLGTYIRIYVTRFIIT